MGKRTSRLDPNSYIDYSEKVEPNARFRNKTASKRAKQINASFYKIIWLPRAATCKKLINKSRRQKIKPNKKKKGAKPQDL
jgi:hypothetical protein